MQKALSAIHIIAFHNRDRQYIGGKRRGQNRIIARVEGDYVDGGQRLLHFDLRELNLTRRQRQADIDEINLRLQALRRDKKADADKLRDTSRLLELAEKNYRRNTDLLGGGVVTEVQAESSEQTFRQRRLEFTQMQNQLADYETREKTAQAQLSRAKAQLAQTALLSERAQIQAPFAGRIARIHTAAGQRPATGGALLEIFNPQKMRLRIALPQRYAAAADFSLRAVLRRDNKNLTLTFDGIEPRVNDGKGSIDVFFSLPGGDWVVGATHEARLELPPLDNLIAVPVDAIYNDDRIYRIGADGRAHAEFCSRAGLGLDGEQTAALLFCPALNAAVRIVANQLPQLANRAKVEVIDNARISCIFCTSHPPQFVDDDYVGRGLTVAGRHKRKNTYLSNPAHRANCFPAVSKPNHKHLPPPRRAMQRAPKLSALQTRGRIFFLCVRRPSAR